MVVGRGERTGDGVLDPAGSRLRTTETDSGGRLRRLAGASWPALLQQPGPGLPSNLPDPPDPALEGDGREGDAGSGAVPLAGKDSAATGLVIEPPLRAPGNDAARIGGGDRPAGSLDGPVAGSRLLHGQQSSAGEASAPPAGMPVHVSALSGSGRDQQSRGAGYPAGGDSAEGVGWQPHLERRPGAADPDECVAHLSPAGQRRLCFFGGDAAPCGAQDPGNCSYAGVVWPIRARGPRSNPNPAGRVCGEAIPPDRIVKQGQPSSTPGQKRPR